MTEKRNPTNHRMTRRSSENNYSLPGMYHVTLHVEDGDSRPFGRVAGDASLPDGSEGAPHVELTAVGRMVQQELLHSISAHYRMVEVQDYVIMPEHMHFIIEVHEPLVSQNGRQAHLGQVIAGFKKGCNRRYWEMTGLTAGPGPGGSADDTAPRRGKPAGTNAPIHGGGPGGAAGPVNGGPGGAAGPVNGGAAGPISGGNGGIAGSGGSCPAVSPQGYKVPSRATTGRPKLFSDGYVDVMPLHSGQLAQQRLYIRNNPRSRLLRSTYRDVLQPQRRTIDTVLSIRAMERFLRDNCATWQVAPAILEKIESRLMTGEPRRGKPAGTNPPSTPGTNPPTTSGSPNPPGEPRRGKPAGTNPPATSGGPKPGTIRCDSYGNLRLLQRRLLPVVCHQRDKALFERQRACCLQAAQAGAVLVSARIAPGEKAIMDAALSAGFPVVLVLDNGMPERYHPSGERIELCLADRLLIVTPWQYHYRAADEGISVTMCKAMNCVVQAICRLKDDWWKGEEIGLTDRMKHEL